MDDVLVLRIVNSLGREMAEKDGEADIIDQFERLSRYKSVESESCGVIFTMPIEEYVDSKLSLRWSFTWDIEDTLAFHLKEAVDAKVVDEKLKNLHKRWLVTGCTCGCRGDYAVTMKALSENDLSDIEVVRRYPRKESG